MLGGIFGGKKDEKVEKMDNNLNNNNNSYAQQNNYDQNSGYDSYYSDYYYNNQNNPNDYPTNQNNNQFEPNNSNNLKQNQDTNLNKNNTQEDKPKKGIFQKIASFFKLIAVLIIIILLLISTLFAYIILSPKSDLSRLVVENTPLNQIISLDFEDNSNEEDNDPNSEEESKILNKTLGLEKEEIGFSFASPENSKTVAEVVEEVLPSVFSIRVDANVANQEILSNAGTGFVVRKDGLIVTNKHVIANICNSQEGLNTSIVGVDNLGETFDLKLLSVDPIYDLAVLKVEDENDGEFSPVKFASTDEVKLGTEVIAIGNVLGELKNTVTKGIISGLNRTLDVSLTDKCTGEAVLADGLLQTDAAINTGNSGGPLFDASGHLVGMNTFGTKEAENIGLAIPSDVIVSGLNSFEENQNITRPRIGIYTRSINGILKENMDWLPTENGEIILSPGSDIPGVSPESGAEKAGLVEGDIILKINDEELKQDGINNYSPIRKALLDYNAGDKITLSVLKVKEKSNQRFVYEENPVEVELVLGEFVFEIK